MMNEPSVGIGDFLQYRILYIVNGAIEDIKKCEKIMVYE